MHGTFRRRDLPHWDVPGATYFITFCLAGSIPAAGVAAISRKWQAKALRPPPGTSSWHWQQVCAAAAFVEADGALDRSPAARWLADPQLAATVEGCLRFDDGCGYRVLAFVVMPNHCHLLIDTAGGDHSSHASRERIMHSIKRHSARECNRLLGRTGRFWQTESYDRVVRNDDERQRIARYIEWNPVKAGLCDEPSRWRFSSAHRAGGHEVGAGA